MRELIPYGEDCLFEFPLIDAGAQDFEATPVTAAAGDAKVFSNKQIAANPTAKTIAFTSGSVEPENGATLTGATSAATATFMFAVVTSGTWGGGDAAGILFVKGDSGTFQAENLNNTTTSTNDVMTIGAALDAAGLFKHVSGGMYVGALTAAETSARQGWFKLVDSATKAFEDTVILWETYGHPLARDPRGVLRKGKAQGGSVSSITLASGEIVSDDELNGATVRIIKGTGLGQNGRVIADSTASSQVCAVEPNWDTAPDSTTVYEVIDTPPNAGIEDAVVTGLTTYDAATGTDVSGAQTNILNNQGTPAGASLAADIAGVKGVADDLSTRVPAALTAAGNMKADTLRINGTAIIGDGVAPKFGV